MKTQDVPLFPLPNLVFPGGVVPLRLFEQRYLDMVSRCLREQHGFVICLGQVGGPRQDQSERGQRALEPSACGSYVEIIDFDRLDDGLLGITARATSRAYIHEPYQGRNGLWLGRLDVMPNEPDAPIPERYEHLSELARDLIRELGSPFSDQPCEIESARWVSQRLTEWLPLQAEAKQAMLESSSPLARLQEIDSFVQQMIRIGRGP